MFRCSSNVQKIAAMKNHRTPLAPLEDLNEFFSVAMALEPVENWQGKQVVKLRAAAWHKVTKDGRKFESVAVSPDRAAEFKPDDEAITYATTEVVKETPRDLSRAI